VVLKTQQYWIADGDRGCYYRGLLSWGNLMTMRRLYVIAVLLLSSVAAQAGQVTVGTLTWTQNTPTTGYQSFTIYNGTGTASAPTALPVLDLLTFSGSLTVVYKDPSGQSPNTEITAAPVSITVSQPGFFPDLTNENLWSQVSFRSSYQIVRAEFKGSVSPTQFSLAPGNTMFNTPGTFDVVMDFTTITFGLDVNGNPASASIPIQVDQTAPPSDYLVGDVYPMPSVHGDLNADGNFTDAGEFGDNRLTVLDLIVVLRAATGIVPLPACTDRFDAADSFPVDTDVARGGDGRLSILDLIILLRRVTGVDTNLPRRAHPASCPGIATSPGNVQLQSSGQSGRALSSSRSSQTRLEVGNPRSEGRGVFVAPVYLYSQADLSGLAFAIRSGTQGENIVFVAGGGAAKPSLVDDSVAGALSLAWFDTLARPTNGRTLLGHIRIRTNLRNRQVAVPTVQGASAAGMDGRELDVAGSANPADQQAR
jgi:hypothetical protein